MNSKAAARGAWIGVPLAAFAWVAVAHSRYYFVFDEWVLIGRVARGPWWREMLIGFNGHLWLVPYWLYHLQVSWFGLDSSLFMYLVFCVSLVAVQLGVAAVLHRTGLPTVLALLAGTVVAFFGRGSETMVLELELGANFAVALACFAGFVALREVIDRTAALTVAALLIGAIVADSGLALVGGVFAGALVVWLWPRRFALMALTPPAIALLAWTILDHSQALVPENCRNCTPLTFSVSLGDSLRFGFNLIARAAGGLVGGFEVAGVIVLVLGLACLGVGLVRGRVPRPVLACSVAGLLAAGVAVVSITYSRPGFWNTIDDAIASLGSPANRYVQPVAVFLMLGLAPAIAATLRPAEPRAGRALGVVAAGALVVVFVLNLSSLWPTRRFYEHESSGTRARVRESVAVLDRGCPPGRTPDPKARPVRVLAPQISVGLLQELVAEGALTRESGRSPSPDVEGVICR